MISTVEKSEQVVQLYNYSSKKEGNAHVQNGNLLFWKKSLLLKKKSIKSGSGGENLLKGCNPFEVDPLTKDMWMGKSHELLRDLYEDKKLDSH